MVEMRARRGDTNVYNVSITRQNALVDLAGSKLWFSAKLDQDDADVDAYIALNSEDDPSQLRALASPPNPLGKAQLTLVPSDTTDLLVDALWYDLQLREPSGVVTTIQAGILKIEKDVTFSTT